jgi:hypothetical protein
VLDSKVTPEDVENLLIFLYRGMTNVSKAKMEGFLRVAKILQIDNLTGKSHAEEKDESATMVICNVVLFNFVFYKITWPQNDF